MKKILSYEIINHGVDHSDYFQGCGTAFTEFDIAVTGIGNNAKEAYEDCLEQLATMNYEIDSLPKRPAGIRVRDKVPAKANENIYYHVSIRIKE